MGIPGRMVSDLKMCIKPSELVGASWLWPFQLLVTNAQWHASGNL